MKNEHKKSPREATTSTKGDDEIQQLNSTPFYEKTQEVCSICDNPLLAGAYSPYGSLNLCFSCSHKAEVDLSRTPSCCGGCGDKATSLYKDYPLCAVCRRVSETNVEGIKEAIT